MAIGSDVGVMAYHGGLETGTYEVASATASSSGASLYTVCQPPELRWHVASSRVDPGDAPPLAAFLRHVRVALSIHGYGRRSRPSEILLGGRNRDVAAVVAAQLRDALPELSVIDDLDDIPVELRGLHQANPVNRPAEAGVQIELPLRVRVSDEHRTLVTAVLARVAADLGGTSGATATAGAANGPPRLDPDGD
jgi:phage replication-related protein YjqB (UPF0714/DUF867 family)